LRKSYFKTENEKWGTPGIIYLDSPFLGTGLRIYYELLDEGGQRYALSKGYENCGIDIKKLVAFCKAVGVRYKLPITTTSCQSNPQWDYLSGVGGQRWTSSSINEDYEIVGLDKLLESPTLEISKLVWNTIIGLAYKYSRAKFQKNISNRSRPASSQLVHVLREKAWVAQKNGRFVKPCDAAREALPAGFPFDEGETWIELVEFGKNAKNDVEHNKHREQQASELGVNLEDIDFIKQHPKKFERLKAGIERQKNPTFPTGASANYERQQKQLEKQIENASEKKYNIRERSKRTTRGTIDPTTWLRNLYTNAESEMVCQICEDEMPFKRRDEEYYFEAVEALSNDYFTKEHEAQFLALCPLCAAMYKYFVRHDEGAMESLKNALINSEDDKALLQLGELDTSVRFVEKHLSYIKIILKTTSPRNRRAK